MPILQQKLVMKSIEALHDEALSQATETASNQETYGPSAVLHAATPTQGSPIVKPSNRSASASPETAANHDIMARIDHLLKKLDDDDDVTITPRADKGPQSNTGDMPSNAIDTVTADNTAIDSPSNPESPVLSNASNHANENAILNAAEAGMAEKTAEQPFRKPGYDASDDQFGNDQPGKTVPSNQAHALAEIAAAIYQAGQEAVDTGVADANQNNTVPFDVDVLSATVADEVRRTVSAVMIAELPQMVHDAVSAAVRSLPADASGQSTPNTINPSPVISVSTRKAAATKKVVKSDPYQGIEDMIDQTVEEIATAFDKTVRGVKTVLTRRGLACADYNPKAGTKKRPEKKAVSKTKPST